MPDYIVDTNILIDFYRARKQAEVPFPLPRVIDFTTAEQTIDFYRKFYNGKLFLVDPVSLEFLGGTRNKAELELAEYFLKLFDTLKEARLKSKDWLKAFEYSRQFPPDGRRRGAIDCLISALSERLGILVLTNDTGFPYSSLK